MDAEATLRAMPDREAALSRFQTTQHMILPYTIEFSGPDEATSIAYMYAQHFLPNDKGDSWL